MAAEYSFVPLVGLTNLIGFLVWSYWSHWLIRETTSSENDECGGGVMTTLMADVDDNERNDVEVLGAHSNQLFWCETAPAPKTLPELGADRCALAESAGA